MCVRNRVLITAIGVVLGASSYGNLSLNVLLNSATVARQAAAPALKTLKPDDYKIWERITRARISDDGRWIYYELARVDADGSLMVRNADKADRWETPNATRAAFSDDSKFVGYIISPPKAEVTKLADEKKPVPTKLGVRNLETGIEVIYDDVKSFQFRKGTHQVIAIQAKTDQPTAGNDLLIFDAAGGDPLVLAQVATYDLNKAQNLLVADIASGSGYSAVQLVDLDKKSSTTIQYSKEDILGLAWAKKANVFTYAIAKPNKEKEGNNHFVFRVEVSEAGAVSKKSFDPDSVKDFPAGTRISERSGIQISPDGSAIAFGLQSWKDKKKPSNPKEKPGVEVWNTQDVRLMTQQKVRAGGDSARANLYVWRPAEDKFQKASPVDQAETSKPDISVELMGDGFERSLTENSTPYQSPVTNGIINTDLIVHDIKYGQSKTILKKNQFGGNASPTGRYVAYYEDKSWWVYDTKSETSARMGSKGTNFENELDDHTVEEKPPATAPIWLDEDKGVIVTDLFDAWLAEPETGKIKRLTQGRKENVEFRFRPVNPSEDHPKVGDPMYFSMLNMTTKQAGFFVTNGAGEDKVLITNDAKFTTLQNCKSADRMMFTMGSFELSPNLFVTNRAFSAAKPVTKTNPQQVAFKWGKSDLIQYKSRWGVPLQGTLIYPADYTPGKQYPMVTYIYERLSQDRHEYELPADWDAYNVQVLSQNGYFVYQPDIAYKGTTPGENAVDCLEPAVDAVLKKNVGVDAKRVGLIGHSWGAYQTAFVTTVSDRFAVGACGAPLTELTSMYNSFYWNAGLTDQTIFETSQGRMRVPFWENPKPYIDNSPVWQSSKRKAPILFAFGDADGAVDWHQGQYLYNTLRRMGKNAVMLVYAGENHGLAKRPNQLDYAHRLRHFLDVYLKGAKPESWVKEGVPLLQQLDK